MQTLIRVLCFLLCISIAQATDSTNYTCGAFSQALKSRLATTITSFPDQIVRLEGQFSNDYSSVRGESDYFIVTGSTNGARLLRMDPLVTSNFAPWYGAVDSSWKFTDVLSGEVFDVPTVRNQDPNGGPITHRGSFLLDGRDVYIFTTYRLSPRYPTTMLTWGIGSTYSDPGLDVDNAVCPPESPVVPENQLLAVQLVSNNEGSIGAFLTFTRPLHVGNQIDTSTNMTNWVRLNKANLLISGDGKKAFYQSLGTNIQFFRMVNSE